MGRWDYRHSPGLGQRLTPSVDPRLVAGSYMSVRGGQLSFLCLPSTFTLAFHPVVAAPRAQDVSSHFVLPLFSIVLIWTRIGDPWTFGGRCRSRPRKQSMDVHTHLNYQYPATINPALLQLPQQQAQASPHHRQMQMHHYQHPQAPSHPATTSYMVSRQGPSAIHPNVAHSTGRYDAMDVPSISSSISDKYIPSSTDKLTCADHRPLDEIFASVYTSSSKSRHLPSGSRVPQPILPSHHMPSQSHRGHQKQVSKEHGEVQQGQPVLTYPLPSKPHLKGVLQIPLHAVDNHMKGTDLVVNYRRSDWGVGVQMEGIPMTDLLYHHARGLERAHDRVLDGYGLASIRLNIIWPCYPPFAKLISAFGVDGKPITRGALGYEVSLAFAEFIYQINTRSIRPTQPTPYSIALSQGTTSAAPEGIRLEQLHLASVRNTSRGEWMAEVTAVVAPI